MTGRVNWKPGKSRNAADKTTAGLKDFQRQLRDSGGGFRNNKRVKLGIRVEVQRVKRRSRQTAVGILSTNNAPQNDEDEDEGSSEEKAASQQNPSLASVPRTVRSRPSAAKNPTLAIKILFLNATTDSLH